MFCIHLIRTGQQPKYMFKAVHNLQKPFESMWRQIQFFDFFIYFIEKERHRKHLPLQLKNLHHGIQ